MTQPSFRKCITISKTNKTTFLVKNIYLYSTLYLIKCNLLLNYCRFFFFTCKHHKTGLGGTDLFSQNILAG